MAKNYNIFMSEIPKSIPNHLRHSHAYSKYCQDFSTPTNSAENSWTKAKGFLEKNSQRIALLGLAGALGFSGAATVDYFQANDALRHDQNYQLAKTWERDGNQLRIASNWLVYIPTKDRLEGKKATFPQPAKAARVLTHIQTPDPKINTRIWAISGQFPPDEVIIPADSGKPFNPFPEQRGAIEDLAGYAVAESLHYDELVPTVKREREERYKNQIGLGLLLAFFSAGYLLDPLLNRLSYRAAAALNQIKLLRTRNKPEEPGDPGYW